ncbi:MAG: 3-isopropylmalate dehydratase small subunit [Bowdeniella nasicola]|nr:3-isopropylmalate dehydratase small subunit [Bowdeniella nasicola]
MSFRKHTGIGVPLERTNVDTDQIIPAVYLKRVTKSGYDDALFAAWRREDNFVLNDPAYAGGSVLVAGADFGTGSSREHAVWALRDYGFTAVLSPRFADIFRGNSGKQGLLTGQITEEARAELTRRLRAEPGAEITVDLEEKTVTCGDFCCTFEVDDYTRWRLLEGLDDISLTLQHEDAIGAYEASRPTFKPQTL